MAGRFSPLCSFCCQEKLRFDHANVVGSRGNGKLTSEANAEPIGSKGLGDDAAKKKAPCSSQLTAGPASSVFYYQQASLATISGFVGFACNMSSQALWCVPFDNPTQIWNSEDCHFHQQVWIKYVDSAPLRHVSHSLGFPPRPRLHPCRSHP